MGKRTCAPDIQIISRPRLRTHALLVVHEGHNNSSTAVSLFQLLHILNESVICVMDGFLKLVLDLTHDDWAWKILVGCTQ